MVTFSFFYIYVRIIILIEYHNTDSILMNQSFNVSTSLMGLNVVHISEKLTNLPIKIVVLNFY